MKSLNVAKTAAPADCMSFSRPRRSVFWRHRYFAIVGLTGSIFRTWISEKHSYLARVVSGRGSRPPDAPGVYVLSEHAWQGIPDRQAIIIYAGQAPYLRYRIGQLLCHLFGFTGDDPADGEAYEHRGGHLLWRGYCLARRVEPLNLYFAWCTPCKCMDRAEIRLLDLVTITPAPVARRTCDRHNPTLDSAYNCSASVTLAGVSARLLNTDKS